MFVFGFIIRFLLTSLIVAGLGAVVFALLPVAKVPLKYNLRNLQVRWKTSAVTALAFTLVVSLLVVMLAFVKGMQKLTEESGEPGNVLVLADGATDESFSNIAGSGSVYLLPKEVQDCIMRDDAGTFLVTREVYVIVTHTLPDPKPGGKKRRFVQMRGIDDPQVAARVHNIQLEEGGRWWSPSGVKKIRRQHNGTAIEETAYEVVLGQGMAHTFGEDLGIDKVGPGTILSIGPRTWYVVGIMKPDGSTFGSEIWTRDEFIKKNFGRENAYSSFVVRTASAEIAAKAARFLRDYQGLSLGAMPETEYYAKLNQTNQQFLVAIMFVAVIMSIGGVLGIMNTMFAAVSQRSRDIGVLRLLGFTRGQILMSFLLESMVIAVVGGGLGCLLGWFADGLGASSIVSSGGGGGKGVAFQLVVDRATLVTAALFTLVMGALGGLVPALSTLRLRPLESLR